MLLCAVLIAHMLVSLIRAGDERRQMIVGKACTTAFCATVDQLFTPPKAEEA